MYIYIIYIDTYIKAILRRYYIYIYIYIYILDIDRYRYRCTFVLSLRNTLLSAVLFFTVDVNGDRAARATAHTGLVSLVKSYILV